MSLSVGILADNDGKVLNNTKVTDELKTVSE